MPPVLPKPKTFDDVCSRIDAISGRVETIANAQLTISQQMGAITAEMSEMRRGKREVSHHDFDVEFQEARDVLSARIKDPRDRMTSERARAIANEAVQTAKVSGKAAAYDAWRTTSVRVAVGVMVGVIISMVLAHFGVHP